MRKLAPALLLSALALPAHAADPQPFTPTTGATVGKTVKVTANANPASVAGTVVSTAAINAPVIRVCNAGTVMVFVRITAEATPVATAADIPLTAASSGWPCIIVQNPVAGGTAGVAALSSTTTAADVYFTPGLGGF